MRRDVVSAGLAGDNVTIRFQTDNAGPWILHWFVALFSVSPLFRASNDISRSHIDWHLDLYVSFPLFPIKLHTNSFRGLAVVFAEDVATIAAENPPGKDLFFVALEPQLNEREINFSCVGPAMPYLRCLADPGFHLKKKVEARWSYLTSIIIRMVLCGGVGCL